MLFRSTRDRDDNPVEVTGRPYRPQRGEVTEVRGVERAAEDAEATVHAHSLNRESPESPLRPFQVGLSSFRLS